MRGTRVRIDELASRKMGFRLKVLRRCGNVMLGISPSEPNKPFLLFFSRTQTRGVLVGFAITVLVATVSSHGTQGKLPAGVVLPAVSVWCGRAGRCDCLCFKEAR
jgi:hypothetical protein